MMGASHDHGLYWKDTAGPYSAMVKLGDIECWVYAAEVVLDPESLPTVVNDDEQWILNAALEASRYREPMIVMIDDSPHVICVAG